MPPEIKGLTSLIRKKRIWLASVAFAAGLTEACSWPGTLSNDLPAKLPDEISIGRTITGSATRISLVYRRGLNPIFCSEVEPLKNTKYQIRTSNLILTRGSNPEISQNESEIKLTPTQACNL